MGRPVINPTDYQDTICAYIVKGAFPHVAAEAAGVSKEQFEDWLRLGQKKKAKPVHRQFVQAVMKAKATARVLAEIAAFENDPVTWLKSGPGKETQEALGWTSPTKQIPAQTNNTLNVMLHPQMQGLFASLLQILAPFPEARIAVTQALAKIDRQG